MGEKRESAAVEEKKLPELSEEEKQKLLSEPEFAHFFDRAVRVLERALTEKVSSSLVATTSKSFIFMFGFCDNPLTLCCRKFIQTCTIFFVYYGLGLSFFVL